MTTDIIETLTVRNYTEVNGWGELHVASLQRHPIHALDLIKKHAGDWTGVQVSRNSIDPDGDTLIARTVYNADDYSKNQNDATPIFRDEVRLSKLASQLGLED